MRFLTSLKGRKLGFLEGSGLFEEIWCNSAWGFVLQSIKMILVSLYYGVKIFLLVRHLVRVMSQTFRSDKFLFVSLTDGFQHNIFLCPFFIVFQIKISCSF